MNKILKEIRYRSQTWKLADILKAIIHPFCKAPNPPVFLTSNDFSVANLDSISFGVYYRLKEFVRVATPLPISLSLNVDFSCINWNKKISPDSRKSFPNAIIVNSLPWSLSKLYPQGQSPSGMKSLNSMPEWRLSFLERTFGLSPNDDPMVGKIFIEYYLLSSFS